MVTLSGKPVVLLGFMGSGKSTLGKQVATSLGWVFTDLDRFIETEENRTIADIFEKEGEAVFRKLEANALRRVLAYPQQVIAIGGGTPCFTDNLHQIKEKSISIYLKISQSQLFYRLTSSPTPRPLLIGKSESETRTLIAGLLDTREPFYGKADMIIESDAITPDMILSSLQQSGYGNASDL